jgi:GNAT superfamily N-acetyltransferase
VSGSVDTPPGDESNVVIRPYQTSRRPEVLAVDFETGFLGSSMDQLIDTPEIFTRGLDWYLRRYPDYCFVAERGGVAGGYVAAAPGNVRLGPALATIRSLFQDLMRIRGLSQKDRRYISSRLLAAGRIILGEERRFRTPGGARLHINLLPAMRNGGAGSLLLETLFNRLESDGVTRVHANSYQSARNQTAGFWLRNGFEEFSRVRTSAWRDFLDDEVDLVCYLRELS